MNILNVWTIELGLFQDFELGWFELVCTLGCELDLFELLIGGNYIIFGKHIFPFDNFDDYRKVAKEFQNTINRITAW